MEVATDMRPEWPRFFRPGNIYIGILFHLPIYESPQIFRPLCINNNHFTRGRFIYSLRMSKYNVRLFSEIN